jgi:hypothetical protein
MRALIAAALLAAIPAAAQVEISTGVTGALMEFRKGQTHPVSVAQGLGPQISFSLKQLHVEWRGADWDLISLEAATWAGSQDGLLQGSAAVSLCTMNQVLCAGVGFDLYGPLGGLFATSFGGANVFPVLTGGFNFGWSSNSPPLVGADEIPERKHGFTFYLADLF